MPMSPETQAKIEQALADKQSASDSDQSVQQSQQAVDSAQTDLTNRQTDSVNKHKAALASAHLAIDSLMNDLGVQPTTAKNKPRT
jgi:DNA-binding protein H-NS